MADVLGAIGGIADDLGVDKALDYMAPTPQAGGQGFSFGQLLSSLGQGARDVVGMGPGAIVATGSAAADLSNGLSNRDRLLLGGMAALGVGLGARQAHLAWKASLTPDDMIKAAPAGYANLLELGDRPRFTGELTPAGQAAMLRYTGVAPRMAETLGAVDFDGVMRGVRRWSPDDAAAETHGKALFQQYATRVGSAENAQVDWARFDNAIETGIFSGPNNTRIRELWRKLTQNPQSLSPSETDELFGTVAAVSDATQYAGHDFSVGVVGRIDRIEMSANGPIIFTRHPVGWVDGSSMDQKVREARLAELNYRNLASRGKDMLRTLYDRGMQDWDREEGVPRRLPQELEVGPKWYPQAREDVIKAFGLRKGPVRYGGSADAEFAVQLERQAEEELGSYFYPNRSFNETAPGSVQENLQELTQANRPHPGSSEGTVDEDAVQRAIASVSFLSEAENWSTNIEKAKKVMQSARVTDGVADPDFQSWLRQGKGGHVYTGSRGPEHQRLFNEIHKQFTGEGFKVSKPDLGVVLRLQGKEESTAQIFATTERRKQKNFYLNIYRPDLPYPVTIDRHAFDAFLGMDTGVQDRPIDLSLGNGDQVYDVVADTYRALADELKIPPHQLQAVVWETWRMLKQSEVRGGWARNDPFMLPEPSDGSTNIVFEALNGRDMALNGRRQPLVMPTKILQVDGDGLASAAMPDGTVAHIAEITDEAAAHLREYYPAVLGRDGLPRWAPVTPRRVQSIGQVRSSLAPHLGARGEAYLNGDLQRFGSHPVLDGSTTITYDLPDGAPEPRLRGLKPQAIGRVEVDEPEFRLDKLGPEDLTPQSFDETLKTHAWATISAERPGMDAVASKRANNKLRSELLRRGYKPVEAQGVYKGESEPSFLVVGIEPEDARALGSTFDQESVLTNHGLLYSDGRIEPPGPDGSTRVVIGGQEIEFTGDQYLAEPGYTPSMPMRRTTRVRRKMAVKVSPGRTGLVETAEELEAKGAQNVSIYTNRPSLDMNEYGVVNGKSWQRATEHVYTDGVSTYALRTTNPYITAPNAGFVFTRSLDGLPKEAPTIQSTWRTFDDIVAQHPGIDVTRRGNKVILAPIEDGEVSSALQLKTELESVHSGEFEIHAGGDRFGFPTEPKNARRNTLLLRNGSFAPAPRRDRPLPDWEWDFGFEFDPSYRVGNKVVSLPDRTIAGLRQVTEEFYGEYGDAFKRWRMPRITVSPGLPKQYAQIEWRPGGMIVLSKEWWSDMDKFMSHLWDARDSGFLAKGAEVSPESVLAHEYGHMIHGSIVAAQGWRKAAPIDKELRKLAKSAGKGPWYLNAKSQISTTAGSDPSELVAEAFSEFYTGHPSALSRQVVALINEELQNALKYRKVVGL